MISERVYSSLIQRLHPAKVESDANYIQLSLEFNAPIATLRAIHQQCIQEHTRRHLPFHHRLETMKKHYEFYERERDRCGTDILLSMAEEHQLPACLIARIILRRFVLDKEPGLHEAAVKTRVSQWMKQPSLIEDKFLSRAIEKCIETDHVYSPKMDAIRQELGEQYEIKLRENLKTLNIPFNSEEELRVLGYPKTPDSRLAYPIVVGDSIVNWIESKASFGDMYTHTRYLQDQYWSYHNRYGPGLVIYWFGFIQDLDVHRAQGIMIMDHFPEQIERIESPFLKCLPAQDKMVHGLQRKRGLRDDGKGTNTTRQQSSVISDGTSERTMQQVPAGPWSGRSTLNMYLDWLCGPR